MALLKLLLSILRTEYETPAVGEWVTSRQADVEGGTEASHTTSEDCMCRQNRYGTIYTVESRFYKGKAVRP
jgi:hypothetical protein